MSFEQNNLGQNLSLAVLALSVSVRPCTNGGLAFSAKCECGASEQTADHVVLTCPHTAGISRNNGLDSFCMTKQGAGPISITASNLIWATQQAGVVKG